MIDIIAKLLDALLENGLDFVVPDADCAAAAPALGAASHGDADAPDAMYAPHAHPRLTELILRLSGCLRLRCGSAWLPCADGKPRVFLPGSVHGECWQSRDVGYSLLWGCQLPQGVHFHITEYEPGRGYGLAAQRTLILSPVAADLWALTARPGFSDRRGDRATFTRHLLKILADHLEGTASDALSTADYHERVVSQIRDYICTNLADDLRVERLAAMVRYSPAHLGVLFRRHTGGSVHRFVMDRRLDKARDMLDAGRRPVRKVAKEVGFLDPLYFSKAYHRRFGLCPSAERERNRKPSA